MQKKDPIRFAHHTHVNAFMQVSRANCAIIRIDLLVGERTTTHLPHPLWQW
jgi:hypothetical protein